MADVGALAEVAHSHGVPLVVDEAWGAHLAFHDDLPAHALVAGRGPGGVEHPQDRRQPHPVRDGPPGAGRPDRREVVDRCVTLVESTSPNSLLAASLDAARRRAAVRGSELLGETFAALADTRAAVRELPGLDVLDERLAGAPGVFAYDPLRLAIDVRGTRRTAATSWPACCASTTTCTSSSPART